MNTDQARRLVTLHDNADRALANLRNANSMSTDDPRATEMLESAGDAYAKTLVELRNGQLEAAPIIMPDGTLVSHARGELGPLGGDPQPPKRSGPLDGPGAAQLPEGFEGGTAEEMASIITKAIPDGDAVRIVKGGTGEGFVLGAIEGVAEGNVDVRLATDGEFQGQEYPAGATISVPVECLTTQVPEEGSTGQEVDPPPAAA